jgi:hypothetical protein
MINAAIICCFTNFLSVESLLTSSFAAPIYIVANQSQHRLTESCFLCLGFYVASFDGFEMLGFS